jgi:formiminoglutamase
LGIQAHANTQSLFTAADTFKVHYLTGEQINQTSFAWQLAFIDEFILNNEAIYLSICLDVFAESYAPGVSAPQALGLSPWQALPLLKYIIQTGKVVGIDIAELSPPLDHNLQTARLAGMIMAELLEFN